MNEKKGSIGRIQIKRKISAQIDIPLCSASIIVDDIMKEMSFYIKKGENIKISSFGTFIVHTKKERIGRNPRTKEEAIISPRKSVSFRAARKLKEAVDRNAK